MFERIVATAARALRCDMAVVLVREGDVYVHTAAATPEGLMTDFARERFPIDASANFPSRAFLGKTMLHLPDWSQIDLPKHERYIHETFGIASALYWPLLRGDECVGVLVFAGRRANSFGPSEIAHAKSFRDQAQIAIENARLFDELQARTQDLMEALEHQTATGEVLSAISRSPTEVQPVFDAIARSATELCGATSGGVDLLDRGLIHLAAHYNWSPEALEAMGQIYPAPPSRGFASARAILTRSVIHIPDISEDREYTATPVIEIGFRSVLAVPMLRDGQPIGAIALVRLEPRPFSDRQIALLQTFAEQAVIAINNVRLFDEVQTKRRDLEESLRQQTATANVLKVISRSAFDLDAVLKTLTESARSLSGAATATVFLRDGEVLRIRAESGVAPEFLEYLVAHPIPPGRETGTGRVLMTGETVLVPDVLADPDYNYGVGPQLGNYRALLGVPLIRDGKVEGVFGLQGREPGAFTQRQIELVRTFADQAVIAIENARLFNEVQAKTRDLEESLQQQTATADVLKVISRSAFDLQAVLHTLVESAAKLCDADKATITRQIDGVFYRAESYRFSEEFMGQVRNIPVAPERGSITGRVMLEGKAIQVEDVEADPEYWPKNFARPGELRTGLGIPMMRNGAPIGVLALMRVEVRPFNAKQIDLVQTFADQAVIAIENVRLFDEVQAKTRDLQESLEQQTASAEILQVISSSPTDVQPVFDAIAHSAAVLCEATNGTVFRLREGLIHLVGYYSLSQAQLASVQHSFPAPLDRGTASGREVRIATPSIILLIILGRARIHAIRLDWVAVTSPRAANAAKASNRAAAATCINDSAKADNVAIATRAMTSTTTQGYANKFVNAGRIYPLSANRHSTISHSGVTEIRPVMFG